MAKGELGFDAVALLEQVRVAVLELLAYLRDAPNDAGAQWQLISMKDNVPYNMPYFIIAGRQNWLYPQIMRWDDQTRLWHKPGFTYPFDQPTHWLHVPKIEDLEKVHD